MTVVDTRDLFIFGTGSLIEDDFVDFGCFPSSICSLESEEVLIFHNHKLADIPQYLVYNINCRASNCY